LAVGREGITSGDLDEDDGVILVVVQLGDVGLSTSGCLLGGSSRIDSSALRAILVEVVLAALAGGAFVAAGAQLGGPDRGRSALGAARLGLRRLLVGGGAALLVLPIDAA
jgi:hypothetical protein